MNEDVFSGKWKEVKGELRSMWGDLTDDELEKTKGDTQSILGLLEQKYGRAKENFSDKLNQILAKFNLKGLKTSLKNDLESEEKPFKEEDESIKKVV